VEAEVHEAALEVEVGEIGKTDPSGRVLTRPDEATTFLKALGKRTGKSLVENDKLAFKQTAAAAGAVSA
jgi:hypothetical protein